MDKIADTRTEFRLKQWTKIIDACQNSGMTIVIGESGDSLIHRISRSKCWVAPQRNPVYAAI